MTAPWTVPASGAQFPFGPYSLSTLSLSLPLPVSFPFHLLLCALTLSRLRELQQRIYRVVQPASRYRA